MACSTTAQCSRGQALNLSGKKSGFALEDSKTLGKAFDDLKSNDEDLEILTNEVVQPYIKKVEDELLEGKLEEETVKLFHDKINEEVKRSLVQKRDTAGFPSKIWRNT